MERSAQTTKTFPHCVVKNEEVLPHELRTRRSRCNERMAFSNDASAMRGRRRAEGAVVCPRGSDAVRVRGRTLYTSDPTTRKFVHAREERAQVNNDSPPRRFGRNLRGWRPQ